MKASFALNNYYGSPRITTFKSYTTNIKLFNRAIGQSEIYSENRDGLAAYWTFQKTDKEIAYDEISGLPLLMWQPFQLVEDDIIIKK